MTDLDAKIAEMQAALTDLHLKYTESEAERKKLEERVSDAEASGSSSGSAGPYNPQAPVIDTKGLGRPDVFTGETKKWKDFHLVGRAYLTCFHGRLDALLKTA